MSFPTSFRFLPLPTEIHFGPGILSTLPERIRALGGGPSLLVTDAGMRAAGLVDRVEALLREAGLHFRTYDAVTADSGTALIAEATAMAKQSGAAIIIGLGGGSSLDTAKAVAAMCTNPGKILDYAGIDKLKHKPLPVVAIPTAAGTGSEVTFWSVFLDDTTRVKAAVGGVLLFPTVALCDPELTLTLPPSLTATTGMDALGHAIECFVNDACQPISAALALEAIRMIGRHLRSAVLNGRQIESRSAMLLASTMAGIAMNSTRLGLAHAFAMPLGSFDLRMPHGLAIGITLPYVMRFNAPARPERYTAIAEALGEPVAGLPLREAAARAADAVAALARDIGIPAQLSQAGMREEHIDPVAAEAIKSGNVAVNPRRATLEDLKAILKEAL
ncbi:MAG: iron-containing alcohol dehydrogenase [Bryobacteraceae bacterium]